jgi:tetratricopeptide (TPR) repeat protein
MKKCLAMGAEFFEAGEQAESEVEGWIELADLPAPPTQILQFARSKAWLTEARGERREDPERCLFAAVLAVSFADSLNPGRHPDGEVAKIQAESWTEMANARRLTGNLEGAEAALHRALAGVQDFETVKQIGEVTAFLFIATRRFDEAEEILADLQKAYAGIGDTHSAGRVCLRRGTAAMYQQNDRLALDHYLECLRLLDLQRDPALTLAAFHNTIDCTTRLGHFETAREWLDRCEPMYKESGDEIDRLRRRWVEAQIEAGLGNLPRADAYLRGVRTAFEDHDLFYQASLVTLDLCAIWIRRGKFREVACGVDDAVSTFQALKIRREALAGLLLLQEAARGEQATVAMVQAAGAALRAEGR